MTDVTKTKTAITGAAIGAVLLSQVVGWMTNMVLNGPNQAAAAITAVKDDLNNVKGDVRELKTQIKGIDELKESMKIIQSQQTLILNALNLNR